MRSLVRLLVASLTLFWLSIPAVAQPPGGLGTFIVASCGTLPTAYTAGQFNRAIVMDVNGNLCSSVSVSASITGFAPSTTGTPISVTSSAGGVTGTLPAGAVVVASNVGTTNTAYCKLGATSTTSDQPIAPNGGWFAFTVGAATQLTCITSTSTTTVNMVGGSGLPTGTGGGGGGSSGGAITIASGAVSSGAYSSGSIASGAYASGAFASGAFASGSVASGAIVDGANVVEGLTTDTAATAGSTGTLSAKLRLMTSQLNTISTNVAASIPAGTNTIGNTIPAPTSSSSLALTHAVCGSAVSSCVLKASAGNFYGVYAECSAACWLMVFNVTSAPSNGATTAGTASGNMVECIAIPAHDQRSLNYPTFPIAMSVGITAAISSTECATLTLATTGFVHGTVQ